MVGKVRTGFAVPREAHCTSWTALPVLFVTIGARKQVPELSQNYCAR